jgi:hypothetical protein
LAEKPEKQPEKEEKRGKRPFAYDKRTNEDDDFDWGGRRKQQLGEEKKTEPDVEKELPCFEPSGILAEFYNTVKYLSTLMRW